MERRSSKEKELKTMCADYSQFFQFPSFSNQPNAIKEIIEQMLTQIDEFTGTLESVRLNTETTSSLVASLVDNSKQLQQMFSLIDSLEQYVAVLNQVLDQLEERTTAAEQSYSTLSQAKRVLTAISVPGITKKQEQTPSNEAPKIEIPNTKQFFTKLKLDMSNSFQ